MSIAVFVTDTLDAKSLVLWGAHFAYAAETELLIVIPRKSKGEDAWKDIKSADDAGDNKLLKIVLDLVVAVDPRKRLSVTETEGESTEPPAPLPIRIREIAGKDPESAFADSMLNLDLRLLLIPAHEPTKSPEEQDKWIYRLLVEAPCETMVIRGAFPEDDRPLSIVVATEGEPDTDIALQRAQQLTDKFEGETSLLYVRPDDDSYAMHVARYQLERLDKNVRANLAEMPKKIALQESLRSAIKSHCVKNQPDLVLVGTRNVKKIKDLLRPWDSGDTTSGIPVATIRDGVPLSGRLLNEVRLWVRSHVPQMKREQRVKLVDGMKSSSDFDFDFIALIVLSTLIAALGLVQDSGAVVIGAMLVAPLMTPLVGIGFSLVQGNERLVKNSLRSVLYGFAVAFVVALILGVLIQVACWLGIPLTEIDTDNYQLQARGHPNLLDWFIAFASGIAAAYAIGRPNLVSALPGVAIAAALVPPIATSGLAMSTLRLDLSFFALLLFFANIVAIALGTAITFWAAGVDSRSGQKTAEGKDAIRWPRYYFAAFVLLSVLLAGAMSFDTSNEQGKENEQKSLNPPTANIK